MGIKGSCNLKELSLQIFGHFKPFRQRQFFKGADVFKLFIYRSYFNIRALIFNVQKFKELSARLQKVSI